MKTFKQINELIRDKTFRTNLINDPDTYANQLGYHKEKDGVFKVVINTKAISYYVLADYDHKLDIQHLQAGVKAGTLGSVSTAGTVLTITGTASSGSSVGSVGTVGK